MHVICKYHAEVSALLVHGDITWIRCECMIWLLNKAVLSEGCSLNIIRVSIIDYIGGLSNNIIRVCRINYIEGLSNNIIGVCPINYIGELSNKF